MHSLFHVVWVDKGTVRQGLKTQLLDYDILAPATYVQAGENLLTGAELKTPLGADFSQFGDQEPSRWRWQLESCQTGISPD